MASTQQTFSMIKPDAVAANHIGAILSRYEAAGLEIIALKMTRLSVELAREFYSVHRERPFFDELVEFITSGPVVPMVLEGPDAVARVRAVMGATNPAEAEPGTIRRDFATDISRNAVHGADSPQNAAREIALLFGPDEVFARRR